jgi:hypothetical protein
MSLPTVEQIRAKLEENPQAVTAAERISAARGVDEVARELRNALIAAKQQGDAQLAVLRARKAKQDALVRAAEAKARTAPSTTASPTATAPRPAPVESVAARFLKMSGAPASEFYARHRAEIRAGYAQAAVAATREAGQ